MNLEGQLSGVVKENKTQIDFSQEKEGKYKLQTESVDNYLGVF